MPKQIPIYELLESGDVVEHAMFAVDAREALRNGPKRWSAVPPKKAAAEPEAPDNEPDDLTKIKGIGAKLQTGLNGAGIDSYDALAAIADEDIVDLRASLGDHDFESWRSEAAALAALNG